MLIEMGLFRRILTVTCMILKENFFYDGEAISKFLSQFELRMMDGYVELEETIDDNLRAELKYDHLKRTYFTSYFASEHLARCLTYDCHFEEFELRLFENILPKFTGEPIHDTKPSEQGTDYRELFKEL